jgi:hypothetical protein
VSQISVIFTDASGAEDGSDQQDATGVIAPGQSLTWTFPIPAQLTTSGQIGTVTADQATASGWEAGDELDQVQITPTGCQFETWG